jgi:hypothetical protein
MLKRELEAEVRRQRRVIEELKKERDAETEKARIWNEEADRQRAIVKEQCLPGEYVPKHKYTRAQAEIADLQNDARQTNRIAANTIADLQNEVARLKGSTTDAVETVVAENERLRERVETAEFLAREDRQALLDTNKDFGATLAVLLGILGVTDDVIPAQDLEWWAKQVRAMVMSMERAIKEEQEENERLRGELEHVRGEVERAKESDDLDGQVREQEKRLAEHAKRIHAQRNEIDNYQRGAVEHHKQYNELSGRYYEASRIMRAAIGDGFRSDDPRDLATELVRQNDWAGERINELERFEDAAHNAIQERDFCARQATRAQAKLDAFVALAKSMEVDT